jgi:hypothetical protein
MIDATLPTPVQSLPLLIRFDPKVLTLIDAIPEELARKSSLEGASPKPEPNSGRLELEVRAATDPLSGQGRLLKLRFSARTVRAQTTIALAQNSPAVGATPRTAAQNPSLRVRVGP